MFVNVGGLYLTLLHFEAGEAPVPALGPAFLSTSTYSDWEDVCCPFLPLGLDELHEVFAKRPPPSAPGRANCPLLHSSCFVPMKLKPSSGSKVAAWEVRLPQHGPCGDGPFLARNPLDLARVQIKNLHLHPFALFLCWAREMDRTIHWLLGIDTAL